MNSAAASTESTKSIEIIRSMYSVEKSSSVAGTKGIDAFSRTAPARSEARSCTPSSASRFATGGSSLSAAALWTIRFSAALQTLGRWHLASTVRIRAVSGSADSSTKTVQTPL